MRININKALFPLKFTLRVLDRDFKLLFREHKILVNDDELNTVYKSRIYVTLYNEDDEVILENEKLVYGVPIGIYLSRDRKDNLNPDFPEAYIFPWSEDGVEREVNYENLNNTIYIEFIERVGEDE